MAKNHKTKIPNRQLKSIIKIEDGNESKLDASQQRAPRRALDFMKHLERKKEEKSELNGNEKNNFKVKFDEKNNFKVKFDDGKSVEKNGVKNNFILSKLNRNNYLNGNVSNENFKVGKELTNKRVKKKEYHKKKLEKKKEKKIFGYDEKIENLLKEKNQIRFGERVEDIPKFTAFPKKVIKKEYNQDHQHPLSLVEKKEKQESLKNIVRKQDSDQENKIGRARKLKTLPEAERKILLQERSRIIALYRNSKINNRQIN